MASIDMQTKARATGKRLKRPTVKTRPSSLSDTGILVDVTAPDGTRVLIDLDTHRNHKGLAIHVRAKFDKSNPEVEDVSLQVHALHMEHCILRRYYERGDARIIAARCDCGADFVPVGYGWKPSQASELP